VTVESKSQAVASTTSTNNDYSTYSAQQNAPTLSPIPPQPVPTTSYNADIQRQTSLESEKPRPVDEKPMLSTDFDTESATVGEEHAIERVENVQTNDTQLNVDAEQTALKPNEDQESSVDKTLEQTENSNETETFENELEDYPLPAAPRMITTNYEEDEEEYEAEVQPNEEEAVKLNNEEEQPPQLVKGENASDNDQLIESKPEEPVVVEAKSDIVEETPIQEEPVVEPSASIEEKMEVVERPKVEASAIFELPEEESMEVEEDEELPAKASKSQPKKKPKARPPPKGRKSASGGAQSRKRKKVESEEDEEGNTDNEFELPVPSK
jgi:hypothetical protein